MTEWERLLAGEGPVPEALPPRPIDVSLNKKVFIARIRAELHALLRSLSRLDWDEAIAGLRRRDPTPPGRQELAEAMRPWLEEHGAVRFDGPARLANNTRVEQEGPHLWRVSQLLIDEEGEIAGSMDGVVDLTDDTNPDGPLVELLRAGD